MDRRGFDYELEELPSGEFEVRFFPKALKPAIDVSPDAISPDLWPQPSIDLDLSDLDPPEPMVRLLAEAERLEPGEVIFAILSREPLFLYPELTSRGHQWVGNFDASGSFYRIMIRVGQAEVVPHGQ
jgi:TusA-related sulfurtransferase